MGLLCFAGLECLAAKLPLSAQLDTVCVQGWHHECTTCVVKQGRVFRRPLHLDFMFCSYCFEILNTLRTRGQHFVLGPENYVCDPVCVPWLLMLQLSDPLRSFCPFSGFRDHPKILTLKDHQGGYGYPV